MPSHNPEITERFKALGFNLLEHEGHVTYERTRDGMQEIICKAGLPAVPRKLDDKVEYYRCPANESPEDPERVCRLSEWFARYK